MVKNITLTGLEKADVLKIFFWKSLAQQKEWGKADLLGLKTNKQKNVIWQCP